MSNASRTGSVLLALLAAALYALSTPCSKVILGEVGPTMLAGLLYVGAGLAMLVLLGLSQSDATMWGSRVARHDAPYAFAMVVLDVAAPILLLAGLTTAPAAHVSLLNNFEIVATACIARVAFGEGVPRRLWMGILAVTASCALLSLEDSGALTFSPGSLLVLAACLCWGIENNCTSALSACDVRQVVAIKGLGSGAGSLFIAFLLHEQLPSLGTTLASLALGAVAYGLSILCYVLAQRGIGAARTSAYYAVAPFVGVLFSWLLFGIEPSVIFWGALLLMALGTWLSLPEPEPEPEPERAGEDLPSNLKECSG